MNNLTSQKTQEGIENRLLNHALKYVDEHTRIIYFGQVVSTNDDKNLNRFKVRIPGIDDIFYLDASIEEGNKKLPWVIPTSSRFIETPDEGTIVSILLSDPKTPYFGRFEHNSYIGMTAKELFDSLDDDSKDNSNWLLVEQTHNIQIPKPKIENEYKSGTKINYNIGIRGKGKNRIRLTKDFIEILQNFSDDEKQSFIKIYETIDVNSSDLINILSKKGRNTNYHPIFDKTLFDYLDATMQFQQKIVATLNSVPAMSPSGPCMPSGPAKKLISELKQLKKALNKLKKEGYSEKIYIN